MEKSIQTMMERITGILSSYHPSIYLFGSVVLNDFKLGWSDIDILCLTEISIDVLKADTLLYLRQSLMSEFPGNPYFRSFEGGILSWDAFLKKAKDITVYWGTSGERICDHYQFDPFSTIELLYKGRLLYGPERRARIAAPTREEIVQAVLSYYHTIRQFANETGNSLYSAGWLLDIARCLYTLKTNDIIAKTEAGKWAIDNNLAPDPEIMKKVVWVRENPIQAKTDKETLDWLASLGPHIQRYADVLHEWLQNV